MTKVVINQCYGGFGISKKCAERMAELGSTDVSLMLEEHIKDGDDEWYSCLDYNYPRHCPILVQAVEELGSEAAGMCAKLVIVTIECDRYVINEYDGLEGISTPEDIPWIVVQPTEK